MAYDVSNVNFHVSRNNPPQDTYVEAVLTRANESKEI